MTSVTCAISDERASCCIIWAATPVIETIEGDLHQNPTCEQSGVSEFSILEEVSDENNFGLLDRVPDHPAFTCFWDCPRLCIDTCHPAHILPPSADRETSRSRPPGHGD